jgi:replicative superfamily II helicase
MKMSLTDYEKGVLEDLRDRGYKILVWTPEQLEEAEKHRIDDVLHEAWWDVIDQLDITIIPEVHMP